MKSCLICIGSNYDRKENLLLARQRLQALFPTVRFATEEETEPLHLRSSALFSNQVAEFITGLEEVCVVDKLKAIEHEAGRRPGDKAKEKICLDIDLLMYNGKILKPEDMEREYVRKGLKELDYCLDLNDMKFIGIIPARYASTRFPAKPLAILGGKTVIQRVYEQVAGILDDAYVATDDVRIEAAVKAFGGKVVMTSATKIGGNFDVVVNIQGDEPFIQPSQLQAIKACFEDITTQIATLVKPFDTNDAFETLENANSPKVVVNKNWNALYFSRSIIPYLRGVEKSEWLQSHTYYKHIGLYAYRTEVLKEITSLPQSSLELAESLEQLRWLENGYTIKVGVSEVETIGIDTPQDLVRAEEFLKNRK